MSGKVIRTLLNPGTLLYFLALLDIRWWHCIDDAGASHRYRSNSMTVVAMAAEDDVISSSDQRLLNDVAQQSTGGDDMQADAYQIVSNTLEHGDDDTELSKSTQDVEEQAAIESHEDEVGVAEDSKTKSSHAPTPSKSSNYLRDIITMAIFVQPTCGMELGLDHVDPGLQIDTEESTSEFGDDEDAHGEVEEGIAGTEEATTQPVKEEEEAEDILTFEEFKQRRMMEVQLHQQEELKNAELFSNGASRGRVSNNYASLECGAKVISTNEEANNPKAILQENRDIYMLSPCSADIWFIVELCDTVLVHSIEIATFELFSSVPEVFAVYTSNRYPAIEWSLIGEFKARTDVRSVQTFPLGESVYAKYIKMEMISHFGSEHYCPLSLLRVLGASFIQEYEDSEERGGDGNEATITTVIPDSNEHASLTSDESQEDENVNHSSLYGAAKDAVWNLLERVSNGLMGTGGDSTSSSDVTSTHTVSLTTAITSSSGINSLPTDLLPAGDDDEQDTQEGNSTNNLSQNTSLSASPSTIISTSTVDLTSSLTSLTAGVVVTTSSEQSSVTDILVIATPSDTLSVTDTTLRDNTTATSVHTASNTTTSDLANSSTSNNTAVDSSSYDVNAHRNSSDVTSGDPVMPTPTNTSDDVIISHSNGTEEEYGEEEAFTDSLPTHQPPSAVAGQQQKSSVLIRLSNRIKELEVNMSLFGDYLERVRTSLQRNKNRTDELQRCIERKIESLNDTVMSLRNESEISWVLLLQLHEDIQVLTKTAIDISQLLKSLQSGSPSWDHLIYEAIVVVMVIFGYHVYYRIQWEATMATMIHKIALEVEQSSRQSNHAVKGRDYYDNNRDYHDNSEYPYTRDATEATRRRKKSNASKAIKQANEK